MLHRKRTKFHSWHSEWLAANLTTQESALCADWLLGKNIPTAEGESVPVCRGLLTECTSELYLGIERSRYTTLPKKLATSSAVDQPEAMTMD